MSSDLTPPRMFNIVTSSNVNYNMDTVEYLIQQEVERRANSGISAMSQYDVQEFRRQLISKLIIQNDAAGAVNLRPTTISKTLLNE